MATDDSADKDGPRLTIGYFRSPFKYLWPSSVILVTFGTLGLLIHLWSIWYFSRFVVLVWSSFFCHHLDDHLDLSPSFATWSLFCIQITHSLAHTLNLVRSIGPLLQTLASASGRLCVSVESESNQSQCKIQMDFVCCSANGCSIN